jgi:hypothetical protein
MYQRCEKRCSALGRGLGSSRTDELDFDGGYGQQMGGIEPDAAI